MRSHGAFHRRAAIKTTMCAPMLSQRNGAIFSRGILEIHQPGEKLRENMKTVAPSCRDRAPAFMPSRGDAPSDIERTGSAAIKAQSVLFGRVNSSPWTSKVRVLRVCLVCSYE
jgi:hypothetical protein